MRTARAGLAAAALLLAPLFLALLAPPAEAAAVVDAGTLPSPRVGSAVASVGNGVYYIFGGRSGNDYLSEIVKYDARTETSTPAGFLPVSSLATGGSGTAGRQSAAAVWTGSKIYVFGGASLMNAGDLNGDGVEDIVPTSIADVVEYDPATQVARNVAATNFLPQSLWGMGAVWTGSKALLFGGFHFDVRNVATQPPMRRDWIMEFDPSPGVGQPMVKLTGSTLPFANQDMATTLLNGKVWMFGGLGDHGEANPCGTVTYTDPETNQSRTDQRLTCVSNRIVAFDLANQVAAVVPATLPVPTQYAASAPANGKVYVLGGRAEDGESYSTIHQLDPSAVTLKTLPPSLPAARFGMPAAADGESILLFGGRDSSAFKNGMNTVLRFKTGATAPFAPRGLVAEPGSDGQSITLKWQPPKYDGGAPVTEYGVYRISAGATPQKLGVATGVTTFTDATASPGQSYIYRVTALNIAGESPQGAEVDTKAAQKPPSAPLNFRAYAGDVHVVLRWSKPAETGGSEISAYRVYRTPSADPNKPFAEGPETGDTRWKVSGTTLQFTDSAVVNGETYTYALAAVNGKGEGARATALPVAPQPVPGTPRVSAVTEAGEALRVEWILDEGTASGFHVYRGTEPDRLTRITPDAITTTSYVDTGVDRGLLYYYAVAGVNGLGEGAWSHAVAGGLLDPPSAPLNLLLTAGPGRISLKWIPPEDLGGAAKVTYIVVRTAPDGRALIVASELEKTEFVDSAVVPGVTYKYVVKAMNGREGPPSRERSGAAEAPVNAPPVAKLTILGSTFVNRSEPVTFDASLSTDDGRIVTYVFDWGDGTPRTESKVPEAAHKFERDEHFVVKLTVVDELGAKSATPSEVHIYVGGSGRSNEEAGPTPVPPSVFPTPEGEPPGSKAKGLPGFEAVLAALALAGVALAARRRD